MPPRPEGMIMPKSTPRRALFMPPAPGVAKKDARRLVTSLLPWAMRAERDGAGCWHIGLDQRDIFSPRCAICVAHFLSITCRRRGADASILARASHFRKSLMRPGLDDTDFLSFRPSLCY